MASFSVLPGTCNNEPPTADGGATKQKVKPQVQNQPDRDYSNHASFGVADDTLSSAQDLAPLGSCRSTISSGETFEEMPTLKKPTKKAATVVVDPVRVRCSRWIVNNKCFIGLTTILTVYALIGDDIRITSTNQPWDVGFDAMTLFCLVVFSFEIVVSCLGKHDYICGFFMALDVVSTATLILDLSYVSDMVMGDGEDLEKMRSGRTARVGAKAGRVVRVIRLVRILKLYKAFYEAAHKKKEKMRSEEDDWDDIDTVNPEEKMSGLQESRVGKKLSEMTTRRVILLVLTMLIVLPFLRTQSADNIPASAYYGADEIYSTWMELACAQGSPDCIKGDFYTRWPELANQSVAETQQRYEEAVLKYIYYHNWFTGRSGGCPSSHDYQYGCSSWYYSHLFWVGMTSEKPSTLTAKVDSVRLRLSTVEDFNVKAAEADNIYTYGDMPGEVLPIIAGTWTDNCNDEDRGIYRRGFSLLEKEIKDAVGYAAPCPSDLRNMEKSRFYPRLLTPDQYNDWHFTFYFDTRPFTRSEALFGLALTGFICVVLCIASLSFSTDANKLVLRPVEQMIKRVQAIRENPLIAMRMADEEFKLEEIQKSKMRGGNKSLQTKLMHSCKCTGSVVQEPMETVVLEKTIIKLGSLLALGFGEAGANIIGQNLACSDSAGVNVMIPGMKVQCIVGKLRINNFSTATEVLQERVMTFVNQIAEIVHGVVDEFWGHANKNNGETFLVIWRTSGLDAVASSKYADMSMMAFAKILGAVHRAPVLAAYRRHPGLQQRLGAQSRVSLTFGLHAGWAIEGAVGSEFKIDASYLSPNVSIASSVEAATKLYQVPILVSQAVVEQGSAELGAKCRLIDRVIIKGSKTPISLYSLDLFFDMVTVEQPRDPKLQWNLRIRFKARQFLEAEKNARMSADVPMIAEFEQTNVIQQMRRRYTMEFLQSFHMGFQNYIDGEWQVAKRLLTDARTMLHGIDDGPCKALLKFMRDHNDFQAPENWAGIREL